ncbi:DUF362 domain-containing protein [Paludisphaera rhizosphaerae]|uniref:DUF362 domain-containing protein n=1 Tax=Paludisphaera rhizosphaerae TaxID=2711216 RepID=UPI0013EDFE6D|nr:DUF362 domain-containing protein [Paludisphaera rhizosphaerae]
MRPQCRRREFLRLAGAAAVAPMVAPKVLRAAPTAPCSPVGIGRCKTYDQALVLGELESLMDKIGGLRPIVEGKTVAVKVNLVGNVRQGEFGKPANRSYQVHASMVAATVALLDRAGAKRIRLLESTHQTTPFETYLLGAGWDINALSATKTPVEFEDTRNIGKGKGYIELKVPGGGSLFPAYHVNHSYVDCDVYVSLCKLKNHATAGVTLGMKNNFGVTPIALYGQHEQKEDSTNSRAMFHSGQDRPADGLPQELHPDSPRRPSYRVPRHLVDSVGIRPIDLVIIDGVESSSGGEGPWVGEGLKPQEPGLLMVGRNPVCTDSVATTVMGYDPMAAAGTGPFPGDNHLAMAAALGLGTNDVKQIEVVGLPIKEALHPYGWEPRQRFS